MMTCTLAEKYPRVQIHEGKTECSFADSVIALIKNDIKKWHKCRDRQFLFDVQLAREVPESSKDLQKTVKKTYKVKTRCTFADH